MQSINILPVIPLFIGRHEEISLGREKFGRKEFGRKAFINREGRVFPVLQILHGLFAEKPESFVYESIGFVYLHFLCHVLKY